MSYSVLYSEKGNTEDITCFVASIQFGGDNQTAVRKLDISVVGGADKYMPRLNLRKGGVLTVLSGRKELIRAVIFKEDRNEKGDIRLSGYTHGIYLTKNKDTKVFVKMKASQIIKTICKEFQIPAGSIQDTGIELQRLILRDKTLWDMMLIALTETTKQNNIKYRIFFREGKLNVAERRKQYTEWVLEEGVNLISANSSSSIEEMKNQVKVIGKGSGEIAYTAKNEEMQRLYGVMQELKEESGDNLNKSQIKQIAENMLKELCKEQVEASVEAIGIDDLEAGMAVYIIEKLTGLKGSFYIEQDDHSIEGNNHTMSLKLVSTEELPSLEYEEPKD